MAEQMEAPTKQIAAFFDLLIETATTQSRKNGKFTIPGLGKLVKAQRAARIGRNPAAGEAIKIKAGHGACVVFRLSDRELSAEYGTLQYRDKDADQPCHKK